MRQLRALAVLGDVAASQFGLVTSAQATRRSIDSATVQRLQAAGLLARVGRGVYLVVGAVPPTHLDICVAWLRLDPSRPAWERDGRGEHDGVVSHRSACLLHQLGDIPAPKVELTVPDRRATRDPWVVLHRHGGPLPAEDIVFVDGLPTTTAERTIVDLLAEGTDGGHIGGVIADADRRGLVSVGALAARAAPFAERYAMPGAEGRELLQVLAAVAGTRLTWEKAVDALAEAAAIGFADALRYLHVGPEEQGLRTSLPPRPSSTAGEQPHESEPARLIIERLGRPDATLADELGSYLRDWIAHRTARGPLTGRVDENVAMLASYYAQKFTLEVHSDGRPPGSMGGCTDDPRFPWPAR